jgi:hypothetical protein
MNGIVRPTGRGDEDQEWTLFGLALHGLAEQFFELNVHWELEHTLLLQSPDTGLAGDAGPA